MGIGRKDAVRANEFEKSHCEMGGKNCVIVDTATPTWMKPWRDAWLRHSDIRDKVQRVSRLIVLEDNYAQFMQRFIAAAASMRVGPAHEPGNVIGPVISRDAQQRILKMIEAGKKEATLGVAGTRSPNNPDACYVPPTIFTDVQA